MHTTVEDALTYFEQLNHAYVAVHKTKEDLFWSTYMATSDDHAGFARAENAYKEFISDPAKLRATRDHLARLQALPAGETRDGLVHGLKGWLALTLSDLAPASCLTIRLQTAQAFRRRRWLAPSP